MACAVGNALGAGWQAVRTNFVPMFALWGLSAAAVAAYYFVPAAAAAFAPIARWQTDGGWLAAFLNRVAFCGLLPGVFLCSVASIRPPRPLLTTLAYALWGGLWGIACDGFFTLQAAWFGCGADWATLLKKTLVDQLVWNVFVCTPANALFFPWAARDFRRVPWRGWRAFVFGDCLTMLVSNWIVWIPVMAATYAFPLPLQIQLVGLAGAFWMLVALKVKSKREK